MNTILISYVPVVHRGYIDFFKKYPFPLYLIDFPSLDDKLREKLPHLVRDIRSLPAPDIKKMIDCLNVIPEVFILNDENIKFISDSETEIVAPDEEITRAVVGEYFHSKGAIFDQSVRLRWGKLITKKEFEVSPDRIVSRDDVDKELMNLAFREAEKSWDWWRRIGALLVKDGKIIFASHNKHLPNEQTPNIDGDARSNFLPGENIELCTAIHGEIGVIAKAAKEGFRTEGALIYVTTFPCPVCVRAIIESGISKLYYSQGYSIMDSEKLLREFGVEIIFVERNKNTAT